MSNRDLSLGLRIQADSSRFVSGLTQAENGVRRFGRGARREIDALKGAMGSLQGVLAQVGLTVGGVALATQSARMDKSLTQIGQTAGVSRAEVEKLRGELFRMAGETGQSVDDLQAGFNVAVQSGLRFQEALPVIDSVNTAVAVTGASATQLTSALGVAASAFDFDLSNPGQALLLLDKMTVAGRLGNAELENLSDIFARVGVNASSAGMGFEQTLAFIETLSMVERQPERLATLADSTLRLFTNATYMKNAQRATGVKFYDAKGERRAAEDVLKDIKGKFDKLKTTEARDKFISAAFGQTDLDTIKGLRTLFSGNDIAQMSDAVKQLMGAGGTLKRDLPSAINNMIDQTGRLKAELRKAADGFAKPINETLQNVIKWGLDSKENGGLGLDGKDMVAGGLLGALGIFGAARYGGKGIGALAGRLGGTAAGVAQGKALEAAAGVTPVFVVNWPGDALGGTGIPGAPGANPAGKAGAAGGMWRLAGTAGMAAAPLALMYGASQWAGDTSNDANRVGLLAGISDSIKSALGVFGFNKDAAIAARLEQNRAELEGKIEVVVRGDPVAVIASSTNPRVPMNVDAGRTMVMP